MNKEQTEFSDAVFKMNSNDLIFALSKGARINKSNTKKNTMNFAIRVLLNHPVKIFNTKFLETLLDRGAEFCNSSDSNANTLESIILYKMHYYIEKAKLNDDGDMAKKNILELLNFILSKGVKAYNCNLLLKDIMNHHHGIEFEIVKLLCKHRVVLLPDVSQTSLNILNGAIKINNPELIRILCQYDCIRPNITQGLHNTLSCAVKTNNLEIVKIICESGAIPDIQTDANTLNFAVETKNPDIIFEIVMKGGKPMNINNYYRCYDYTYDTFCNIMCDYGDAKNFDRIINLLMCSGIIIYDRIDIKMKNLHDSHYKRKILSCYHLLQRKPDLLTKEELQDVNELKIDLIKTMKELMEGPVPKRIIVEQIDIGIQRYIPIPCVDMIYEYQHTVPLVQYIDWSKY